MAARLSAEYSLHIEYDVHSVLEMACARTLMVFHLKQYSLWHAVFVSILVIVFVWNSDTSVCKSINDTVSTTERSCRFL